jgi:parvulin-like peptidyl-prolyl isomerase
MAMMAKMRSLASWFIIGVGGIFVLFMVLSDSRLAEIFRGQSNVIGKVNGHEITQQEFNKSVEMQREQYKAQTGKDIDEEYSDAFRDQVWESMVNQKLIEDQIEKYGITVSDDEINDVIHGPNPPEFLKRQFTDSTGYFNRQLYEQALSQQKNDVLLAVEENVKQMKLTEKLQSYVLAGLNVSEGEIQRRFEDQNLKMNAFYILVDINRISDNEVKISDDDLKAYYEKHLDKFKIENQRKLKYVVFSKAPSAEDSLSIKNNLIAIAKKAKDDTSSFKSYIQIYSEAPYSKDTVKQNQLSPEAASVLVNANPGEIVGPVPNYDGYTVYKLYAKVPSKETFVRASHILIPIKGDEAQASAEAMDVYNKLVAGADFAQMAKEKSADPGSAQRGGDLGWFGKGQMVKEFEDASFNGKIGEIQKPVKSSFGYHIIKVTGKSSNDFVVEKIVNKIKASATTVEDAYQNATDFAYISDKNGFDTEAKGQRYKVVETPPFTADANYVPGIGQSKRLIDWAFDNGVNNVSQAIKVPAGYVVAEVSEVIKAGVKKFDEVKASLKPEVLREKKLEKAKVIADKIEQNIKAKNMPLNMAASSFKEASFDTTGVFTPLQPSPKVGRDYAFNYAAQHANVNTISEPVKGSRGYYIIQVYAKNGFDKSVFAIQRNSIRDNLLQEKKNTFLNTWLEDLKKSAKIVDDRWKFFR